MFLSCHRALSCVFIQGSVIILRVFLFICESSSVCREMVCSRRYTGSHTQTLSPKSPASLWCLTSPQASSSKIQRSQRSSRCTNLLAHILSILDKPAGGEYSHSIEFWALAACQITSVAPGWSGVRWPERFKSRIVIQSVETRWIEEAKKYSPKISSPRAIVTKDKVTLWTSLTSVYNLAVTNAPCPSSVHTPLSSSKEQPFWNALPGTDVAY